MRKKRKKILIVEDDLAICKVMNFLLDQEGYEIITASDGEEALYLAEQESPDLILLDLVIPKINGFQVLEKLKKNEQTRPLDVIVFSNLSLREEVARAKELGAIDYQVKSDISTDELVAVVNRYFLSKTSLPSGTRS